jgi:membrane protease YdiL (CAAX protease family)
VRSRLTAAAIRHPVVAYALLTYAITWLLVLPLVLNGVGVAHLLLPAGWHALGALGPVMAAFVIARITQGQQGTASLLRSVGRWRVGWLWWVVSIGTPLLMLGLGIVFVGVWGQQWPNFGATLASASTVSFWLVDGVLTGVLYGACEEIGWRGFALPRLQMRWNALVSTLLLFGIWAAFHIPFFLYRYPFGLGTLAGFLLGLCAGAIWLTYLYNSTGGGTLITMVWHSLFNVVNAIALVALPPAAAVMSVLAVLLGIAALVIGKPSRLSSARATAPRNMVSVKQKEEREATESTAQANVTGV